MRSFLLALVLLAPLAGAVDVLPTEARLGELEARLVVRSATGRVTVATEPSVLVTSGFEPDALGPAPRELAAERAWRGWDGVVEVLLRRPDARTPVEIVVEDGVGAGVSVGWPAIDARDLPLAGGLVAFALVAAALARRR